MSIQSDDDLHPRYKASQRELHYGTLLLGLTHIPQEGSAQAACAREAARLYRLIRYGIGRFETLMRAHPEPFNRRRTAAVLRRLKKRGLVERDWDRRWYSLRDEQLSRRRWRVWDAQRREETRAMVSNQFPEVFAIVQERDDFRAWLLDGVRYVMGRELRAPEMIRFADLIEDRNRSANDG